MPRSSATCQNNAIGRQPASALPGDHLRRLRLRIANVAWPKDLVQHDRTQRSQAQVVESQGETSNVDRYGLCGGNARGNDQRDGGHGQVSSLREIDFGI